MVGALGRREATLIDLISSHCPIGSVRLYPNEGNSRGQGSTVGAIRNLFLFFFDVLCDAKGETMLRVIAGAG